MILKFDEYCQSLNEGISNVVYHYCSMDNLLKMIKNDKLYFTKSESDCNFKNMNSFSTTRNRNSKMGYPFMQSGDSSYGGGTIHNDAGFPFYFIRIEFDGKSLMNLQYTHRGKHTTIKGKPYDYIYHFNRDENEMGGYDILNSREEIAMRAKEGSLDDDEGHEQPFSQAEDRLFSKKTAVDGFKKTVKRIDILIRMDKLYDYIEEDDNLKEVDKFLNEVRWLMSSSGYDVHVYDNRSHFDLQRGEELTVKDVINLRDKFKR